VAPGCRENYSGQRGFIGNTAHYKRRKGPFEGKKNRKTTEDERRKQHKDA
jgi:hypothetical protein